MFKLIFFSFLQRNRSSSIHVVLANMQDLLCFLGEGPESKEKEGHLKKVSQSFLALLHFA